MAHERRVFERTDVAVEGDLQWQIKRRSGLISTKTVEITTVDLSIDGARVLAPKKARLPIGASVLLSFNGQTSPARVRATLPDPEDPKSRILLLQFDQPSTNFLQIIDQWVDAGKGGNQFKAQYWRNHEAEAQVEAAEAAKNAA